MGSYNTTFWGLLFGAYALGAIPIGVWVAKAHGIDILSVGSGNPGATNINRALGLGWALLVFAGDVLKGFLPGLAGHLIYKDHQSAFLLGSAAVVGHTLSPFIKFKGGKGVATAFGALLGSYPLVAVSALSCFLITVVLSRWISLGSIVAAISLGIFSYFMGGTPLVTGLCFGLGAYVTWKHRSNLSRIAKGSEPKINLRVSKHKQVDST